MAGSGNNAAQETSYGSKLTKDEHSDLPSPVIWDVDHSWKSFGNPMLKRTDATCIQ